jgi:signal transduction histidine kinase
MTLPENSNTRLRLALLFAVPLAFSLLFFIVNIAAEHNDVRLLQMQELVTGAARLQSVANDAEVGEHGFLLTGDDGYLIPLDGANATIDSQARLLVKSDAGSALQRQLNRVISLVRARLRNANQVIETQRTKGFPAALDLAKSSNSEQIMQQIRTESGNLQAALRDETSKYLDQERHLTHWSFLFFLVGTLVMLVVLIWLYNSFVSYMQARDSAHIQLQALNEELERRIDERTKELQQFNEELQQFAYVASHDLQEPLRTITSFTQLLANRYKGQLDTDADEFIGYIVTSAHRMTDLINGMLALVRLRKSGQPTAPVSLDTLLDEAQVSLQASIRESGARIESGPLPSLVVDRIQLAQVFQNLLSNAIKYRREEAPLIRLQAKRNTSHWIFSISDNGRGFDQQFAERIFGLFQRLHGREIDGTGMGLSIAQRIVERHGGRMWAESTEGVGSTFYFSLPVSLEPRAHSSASISELAARS